MTTLRERRRADAIAKLDRTLVDRDTLLRRLVKLEGRLDDQRRQVRRLEKPAKTPPARVEPTPAIAVETDHMPEEQFREMIRTLEPLPPAILAEARATADDDMPAFLVRQAEGKRKDAEVAAALVAEKEDRAKRKKAGQRETAKARNRGELRRMPLTGKAAIAAIRGA